MVLLRSVPAPSEGVRHEQAETTAVLDGKGLGAGTLYVAETRLSWFDGSGMGFSLEYPTISLHAISRDLSTYPQEHLYVMVNAKLNDENEAEMQENAHDQEDEDNSSEEDDSEGITEIRFVPRDKAALESMFSAMCECQALHPDPDDEDSDGDFDGDEYDVEEAEAEHGQGDIPSFCTYEEGVSGLTAEGQATLQRLEGMLAQSVANTFHMAGVRTDEANGEFDDGMEVDAGSTMAGQFEDADADH
ncbi:methylosome subunit pICln-like isoform X1 [Oncorhynchus tshawytscha]|uniref:Methylosome subunit pICln n=1 Tax=Oncorhynchus tshawytscha TaxID=74940 RepID=A0A8C8CTN8_ONCTS|nr:methylosome subunit pICln-like isoform X1 [Oncorhynchus tshawytscha]XP_024258752.1 methylosome subunit pICln-like isoform X2 [Oncorhynchus tshawytscha]XP_024258753.1 methylosome subunit pICln-like isoform X1 [Oncorhynchus tshawytscha]XP_029528532.1 methylosome subunit pICln-like isoform X1 [Oncorhynchus nerka]XP_029528533.1 methylosome subunit pICln-like isoform X2 [Oncorhynchus nerka]XP_046150329.1 methylosome subunit pICln-like isoform X1 [Oncorhynchus gorbuscha]XP_046150330.1 methylosom